MKEIIEQLKTEAPEFFSPNEIDKNITNAKAQYHNFVRKKLPIVKISNGLGR